MSADTEGNLTGTIYTTRRENLEEKHTSAIRSNKKMMSVPHGAKNIDTARAAIIFATTRDHDIQVIRRDVNPDNRFYSESGSATSVGGA